MVYKVQTKKHFDADVKDGRITNYPLKIYIYFKTDLHS